VTRNYVYENLDSGSIMGRDKQQKDSIFEGPRRRQGRDEQTKFMKEAMDNNILLKRDADTFFGESNENPAGFVRNYNQFFRG
jgi:hypothetical protein